ncbi:hypothetical protein M436DRAFT_58934, partial [Aureobasidium namibiae CBS 147.97]
RIDTLLRLIKSFIFITIYRDVFSSRLLHFLAILSILEEIGRLYKANDFLYILARVVYYICIFIVKVILLLTK